MFYHFLKPGCDLDNGLEPLACDNDVVLLGNYVTQGLKLVEVFVEHEKTNPDIYTPPKAKRLVIEELDDAEPRISKAGNPGITPVAKKLVLDVNNKQTSGKNLEGQSSRKYLEGQSSGKDLEGKSSVVGNDGSSQAPSQFVNDFYSSYDPYEESQDPNFDPLADLDLILSTHRNREGNTSENVDLVDTTHNVKTEGKEFPNKEEVKAYIKEHSIENRREIRLEKNDNERVRAICKGVIPYLHTFEDLDLVEQLKTNPKIPVRAVQEQLQQKHELSVTQSKAFRAKQAAEKKLMGDYTLQYKMLRDYVLELQESNINTTVKIHVRSEANHELGDDLDLYRNSNFTFVSDRQKGIIPAIANLFPNAEHRYCVKHIHENMKKKWNVRAKSVVLLNNMCEVFNEKLVAGRDRPIIATLEFAMEYLMKRIVNVNKLIDRCDGPLTPTATKILRSNSNEARKYTVDYVGDDLYQRSHPLAKMQCSNHTLATQTSTTSGETTQRKEKIAAERDVLKIVKNGKPSREHKTDTCNKCNTKGHNSRSCTGPREPKSNKRKVPRKGMDDTDAPVGSQSKKKTTAQAARSATSTYKGKAPT
nr:hypothetical protein [Tanacetum cinerariifolium]